MQRLGFSYAAGDTDAANYAEAKDKVMHSLKEYFRPEFLNRLDDIIVFDILGPDAIRSIVDIQVRQIKERLDAKEIRLELSDEVLTYLAKEGYNPQYGARPLKRLIQNKILTPIASLMITQGVMKGGEIAVTMKGSEFAFDVKKGKKGSFFEKAEVMEAETVAV